MIPGIPGSPYWTSNKKSGTSPSAPGLKGANCPGRPLRRCAAEGNYRRAAANGGGGCRGLAGGVQRDLRPG
eukprot:7601890-Alexandrium_andersonii.AAC.1